MQPVLVVMAAGLGSRYGGLKQIDPLGPSGQVILDYSIFDAHRAGFRKVIFIIKPELQDTFEEVIGTRTRKRMAVQYAYQTTALLPQGLTCPEGRTKPLGTAHAVWCAMEAVAGAPFAVINADDFYGAHAFAAIYDFLCDDQQGSYCMVGYPVENTLTEHGTVSRGVCTVDNTHHLTDICERTKISRQADGTIVFTDAEGGSIPQGTPVSMNLWGFSDSFADQLTAELHAFFAGKLQTDLMKAECYLPTAVESQIRANKAQVSVLHTDAHWFGVTYQEDKPLVQQILLDLTEQGFYPTDF